MAASVRVELSASATVTAAAQGSAKKVPTVSMAMVGVDVTAESATAGTDLAVWLQGSDDGGVTWYDIPAALRGFTTLNSAEQTYDADKRNITDGAAGAGLVDSTEVPVRCVGIYTHLPTDTVRIAWGFVGAGPDFTFSSALVGK